MKYLFILGRNPKLSIAELKSVFEDFDYLQNKNSVLIEFERIERGILKRLGGVIAIGKVLCKVEDLENTEIYFGDKNKINYLIWNFSENIGGVSDILKSKFKSEKLKATEKKLGEEMELQSGERVKTLHSRRIIDKQYFIFDNLFGEIMENCNYKELEKRDMQKPVRREALSISPRLAKIMINLSQVKEKGSLLDSFCGIGVILQEALIKNIKVIGIDNNKNAIEGAKQNFKWFNFSKENYKLIHGDSRNIEIPNLDVLVTEPDFGSTLKKIPTKSEAKKRLKEFEDLMIKVINNLKEKISGKIVFTSPSIRTIHDRINCDVNRIAKEVSLKLKEGPIPEFRKNQIIGREIIVLE